MNFRWSMLLVVVMAAACLRTAAPPKASPAALATQPVEWAKRDPSAPLVPRSVKNLQVVITPGWSNEEHYAWLVSDGTEVVGLYRLTANDIGPLIAEATRSYAASTTDPLDRRSFVMMGSIHSPPPRPPGPPGMPPFYVDRVIAAAVNMNRAAAALDGGTLE